MSEPTFAATPTPAAGSATAQAIAAVIDSIKDAVGQVYSRLAALEATNPQLAGWEERLAALEALDLTGLAQRVSDLETAVGELSAIGQTVADLTTSVAALQDATAGTLVKSSDSTVTDVRRITDAAYSALVSGGTVVGTTAYLH